MFRIKPDGAPEGVRLWVGEAIHGPQAEEPEDAFCFVTPHPGRLDARSMNENNVYATLRKNPSLQSIMQSNPKGFLRDELRIDVGANDILVETETEAATVIVIPNVNSHETLPDNLLDLVVIDGDPRR